MSSFTHLGTVTASTKRVPAIASGKRGVPTTHITSLTCSPLDPAESQRARDLAFRLRQVLQSPFELLQTFVDANLDILAGDVLVVAGEDYPIRGVEIWTWRGSAYRKLFIEKSVPL